MKFVNNVDDLKSDNDSRSLRARVLNRDRTVLRDTYLLVGESNSPAKRLNMGYTTIYPTGSTTGHTHDDMEEVYFVVSGNGIMVVGDEEFEVSEGDGLYVPPGLFHTTFQKGNRPMVVLWVTCKLNDGGEE